MSFDIFVGNNILYGYYMAFHFYWYVELHINPHGLRVMALQRWRTPTWRLEASRSKKSKWPKRRNHCLNDKVKWQNQDGLFKLLSKVTKSRRNI